MITPNYLELTVRDLAEARTFYGDALGFAFTDYGPDYTAVEGGPVDVGFAVNPDTVPPLPLVQTDDLEAAHAAVVDAGGRIVHEPFDYPGGRRFHFLDPSDNEVGVYESAE